LGRPLKTSGFSVKRPRRHASMLLVWPVVGMPAFSSSGVAKSLGHAISFRKIRTAGTQRTAWRRGSVERGSLAAILRWTPAGSSEHISRLLPNQSFTRLLLPALLPIILTAKVPVALFSITSWVRFVGLHSRSCSFSGVSGRPIIDHSFRTRRTAGAAYRGIVCEQRPPLKTKGSWVRSVETAISQRFFAGRRRVVPNMGL